MPSIKAFLSSSSRSTDPVVHGVTPPEALGQTFRRLAIVDIKCIPPATFLGENGDRTNQSSAPRGWC